MAIDTFIWTPTGTPVGDETYRNLKAQFGDGYEQSAGDGLNTVSESWPLTFTGVKNGYITPIRAFLRAKRGITPFYWTTPFGDTILCKADGLSSSPVGGGVFTVTVTFRQVFTP
jgi:phage-related protein